MKILVKVGLLTILVFTGLHYPSAQSELVGEQRKKEQLAQAKLLFKENCARCHGEDGRGQTDTGKMLEAPDFTDKAWWEGDVDDQRLRESVQNGKAAMPKFGKKLTTEEIALLVQYLRRFQQSSP